MLGIGFGVEIAAGQRIFPGRLKEDARVAVPVGRPGDPPGARRGQAEQVVLAVELAAHQGGKGRGRAAGRDAGFERRPVGNTQEQVVDLAPFEIGVARASDRVAHLIRPEQRAAGFAEIAGDARRADRTGAGHPGADEEAAGRPAEQDLLRDGLGEAEPDHLLDHGDGIARMAGRIGALDEIEECIDMNVECRKVAGNRRVVVPAHLLR